MCLLNEENGLKGRLRLGSDKRRLSNMLAFCSSVIAVAVQ